MGTSAFYEFAFWTGAFEGDSSLLFAWKLEFELSGVNQGWTDVTLDVMPEYLIDWIEGSQSIDPTVLLANPGSITFVLDNAHSNSAGLGGYYSLNHANKRSGFAKNIRVRYSIYYLALRYYENVYWLKEAKPTAGSFGEGITRCRATDWFDIAKELPLPRIGVQTNMRVDELITALLLLVPTKPISTNLMTGDSILTSAMDGDDTARDSVYSILGKFVRDEFGPIYLQSDTTGGGKLTFENRNFRLANLTSLGTIAYVMDDVVSLDDAGQIYDQVLVPIKQKRVDTSYVDLARMDGHLYLSPSQEEPFTLEYHDPIGGARISGKDIQPQIAGTDYKFGSTDDGTSQDLNVNLLITIAPVDVGSNSIHGLVKNTGGTGGYINLFKIQGLGIYSYNPLTVEAGTATLRVLTFDQPNQTNFNVAKSIANQLLSLMSDETRTGFQLKFRANKSPALMLAALTGGISTRWTLVEERTGLENDWFVNGRHGVMGLGGKFDMEWTVVQASGQGVWILGTSALNSNTRLAI